MYPPTIQTRYRINIHSTFLLSFLLLFLNQSLYAQPRIQKSKSYGGSAWDYVNSMQITRDGGVILAGLSESFNGDVTGNHGTDYWIVKLNKAGKIQWQKCYGGTGYDEAFSIANTLDGGYIVAGASNSEDGDVTNHHSGFYPRTDTWIVKLNSHGNIEWQKSLGGTDDDFGKSIQQTADSGYIVASWTFSSDGDVTFNHGSRDIWVAKLTKTGTIEWQRSYGGTNSDIANSIQLTKDGGFIVAAASSSSDGDINNNHGNYDYWLLKLNRKGNIEWQKSYGGTGIESPHDISITKDGGYIVVGNATSSDGDVSINKGWGDFWVVKVSNAGIIEWEKSYGGLLEDNAFSVQQLKDSTYIITGRAESYDGDVIGHHGPNGSDTWVLKLSNAGTILWQKCLGGSATDYGEVIKQTPDGGYVVASSSYSTDGDVKDNHGDYDYWITKLAPDNISSASLEEQVIKRIEGNNVDKIIAYPNPAKDILYIQTTGTATCSLVSQDGKLMTTTIISGKGFINVSAFAPGIYYLFDNTTNEKKKIIIIR